MKDKAAEPSKLKRALAKIWLALCSMKVWNQLATGRPAEALWPNIQ